MISTGISTGCSGSLSFREEDEILGKGEDFVEH